MPNDQLTRAERIRLEALSQSMSATALTYHGPTRPTMFDVLRNAEQIEAWIRKARADA